MLRYRFLNVQVTLARQAFPNKGGRSIWGWGWWEGEGRRKSPRSERDGEMGGQREGGSEQQPLNGSTS